MAIEDDYTVNKNAQIISYTGSWTGNYPDARYKLIDFYKMIKNIFDEPAYMDEPTAMEADTTKEYRMLFPWFIPDTTFKTLFEGAVSSDGWKRVAGTNNGIVMVEYSGTPDPIASDIGKPIVHEDDNDAGVLVGFDTVRQILWIRPDDETAANNFDTGSGNLDVTGGTQDIVQTAVSVTGEQVHAGVYTVGNIEAETEIMVIQVNDFAEVTTPALTKLTRWWHEDVDFTSAAGVLTGHIDVLIKIQELDNLVDYGILLVGAKQYQKTYSMWQTLPITGGRTPIPLATLDDGENESGFRQATTDAVTGSWTAADIGSILRLDGAGNERKKCILTGISGSSPNFTIQYYPIGDITAFVDTNKIELEDESKDMTLASDGVDIGPAVVSGVTLTLGGNLGDIDENGSDEYYSAVLDCSDETLATIYEYAKYLARRGNAGDIDAGGQTLIGEFYNALGDQYVPYDNGSQDNPFTEGEVITWTGGSAILTAKQDRGASEGFLVLRQIRGIALADGTTMSGVTSGHNADVDEDGGADPLKAIVAVAGGCALGTYSGGIFTFAYGIKPTNVASADASNFTARDSEFNIVSPPVKVTAQCTGLKDEDRITVFEVTLEGGDIIIKDQHGLAANNDEGDADIVVDVAIPAETPGKTAGGVIRCVDVSDVSNIRETRYRFSSWTGSTFTLSTGINGAADGSGCTTTNLRDTGANFLSADIEVGDRIYDSTNLEYATIVEIVDNDNLRTTEKTTAWTSANYQSNRLDRDYNGAEDEAYVPILDAVRTADGTEGSSLVHSTDINCLGRVRFSSETGPSRIKAFEILGLKVEDIGLSFAAIRTTDPVANA